MNNNRNNRRRGRGNRNQPGNNGQVNRIDSRARGNAPQMLDKYKKLAQDAQHNGDRVQMEYYLQFADHYFRVIADNKARQDEARGRRPDERETSQDDGDDDGDFDNRRRDPRRTDARSQDFDDDQGSASDDDGNGADDDDYGQSRDHGRSRKAPEAEAAPARRPRQRKPREDRPPAEDRTQDAPSEAKRAPKRAERSSERTAAPRRKPRQTNGARDDHDEPAGIDSAVLPPSIRADESDDSDGNLAAVG